jgi:hypothetical protein
MHDISLTRGHSVANATVDLLMMGLWSIVSDQLDKPERIPPWYFARDDRVQKAFDERSGFFLFHPFALIERSSGYTNTRSKSSELRAGRQSGRYGKPLPKLTRACSDCQV